MRGKLAFVPGGYGGIGAAVSRALAKAGAKVIVAGRDMTKASRLARQIRGIPLQLDVRASHAPDVVTATAQQRWGRIDVLVNNAGATALLPLAEATAAQINDLFDLNVTAPSVLTKPPPCLSALYPG